MPDTSASPTKAAHESSRRTAASSPPWWRSPRAATYLNLTLATIAVAVAVAAWFRAGGPSYDDSQSAQAKTNVCAAYATVHQGVVGNTHLTSPNPGDRIGQLAVAANARLALVGGGAYLRDRLAAEPATPADLTQALTSMSTTIEQLGVNYLAGADNAVQGPLRKDLDGEISRINGLCE